MTIYFLCTVILISCYLRDAALEVRRGSAFKSIWCGFAYKVMLHI